MTPFSPAAAAAINQVVGHVRDMHDELTVIAVQLQDAIKFGKWSMASDALNKLHGLRKHRLPVGSYQRTRGKAAKDEEAVGVGEMDGD
jgi:hypothetical protein